MVKGQFTRGFTAKKDVWLTNEEYGRLLDRAVTACADAVVLSSSGEKILLGKRTYEPAKAWWMMGGAMDPGETFERAVARNIQRELGLKIAQRRFKLLGHHSFAWPKRRQPPVENGVHNVSFTFVLQITEAEERKLKPNEEYEALQWFNPEWVAKSRSFLPAVRHLAADVIDHIATQ